MSAAWCHCKQATPLQFCFCHKSFILLVWYPRLPSKDVATTLQLTDFFARFGNHKRILARNIDCRSTFQKNIKAIWAVSFKIRARIEIQEHSSVHLTSQTSLCMSHDMILQSVLFSLAFYRWNLAFVFLKSSLEFILHCGQPNFTGLLVSSPIDQSFSSLLRPWNNNLHASYTVLVLAFFFYIWLPTLC